MKICTEITEAQSKWLLENSVTKGKSNAGQGKVKSQHIKDALQEYIEREEKK